MRIRKLFLAVLVSFPLISAAKLLSAQAVSGTIVGTVNDATGAVVANAQVTMILTGQGTVYTRVQRFDMPRSFVLSFSIRNLRGHSRCDRVQEGDPFQCRSPDKYHHKDRYQSGTGQRDRNDRSNYRSVTAPDRPCRHLHHHRTAPGRGPPTCQRQQLPIFAKYGSRHGACGLQQFAVLQCQQRSVYKLEWAVFLCQSLPD